MKKYLLIYSTSIILIIFLLNSMSLAQPINDIKDKRIYGPGKKRLMVGEREFFIDRIEKGKVYDICIHINGGPKNKKASINIYQVINKAVTSIVDFDNTDNSIASKSECFTAPDDGFILVTFWKRKTGWAQHPYTNTESAVLSDCDLQCSMDFDWSRILEIRKAINQDGADGQSAKVIIYEK